MNRLLVFCFLIMSAVCAAQEVFPADQYQLAKRDPIRDIIHFPQIVQIEVPQSELRYNLEKGVVKWTNTSEWLGGDDMRKNELRNWYQDPKTKKWYLSGEGYVLGFGVNFHVAWEGNYLIEIRNPDHPIVIEVNRNGNQVKATAYVVCE